MNTKILMRNFFFNKKSSIYSNFLFQTERFMSRAYVHKLGSESLVYKNLGEQFRASADRYGDRVALVAKEENLKLTYAELIREAEKLSQSLKNLGLKQGDHLAIWAPNTSQWIVTFLAAVINGFPIVCLNPALQSAEMEYALQKAKVKAIITMDKYGRLNFTSILNELFKSRKSFRDLEMVILKGQSEINFNSTNYDELFSKNLTTGQVTEINDTLKTLSPESMCSLLFTSGTTGKPKAAVLSHFSLLNQGFFIGKSMMLSKSMNTVCLTVPLFHVFGLAVFIGAFLNGSKVVLPSALFDANAALNVIEEEACNVILGTPTMFVDMLQQQITKPRSIKSLHVGFAGGAPCSPEMYSQIKTVFGIEEMRIAYGLTESSGAVFAQTGTETPEQAMHSVGFLYDHLEAKVINGKGETVAFGEQGELCLRGSLVMTKYFEDEAKTMEVISSNGWMNTGDEFILEPNGVGRIVGRKKDMIIRGGENIYPKEVEEVLDTHTDILEAHVIGVPDKRLGEEVCAYLRQRPNSSPLTEANIKEFCKNKLAYFKIPRYVRYVEEFPKTISGKIQKFKLREMFKY